MILENFRFFDLPSIYTNNKNYTRRRILKIKYFSENKLLKQLINLIYLSTFTLDYGVYMVQHYNDFKRIWMNLT